MEPDSIRHVVAIESMAEGKEALHFIIWLFHRLESYLGSAWKENFPAFCGDFFWDVVMNFICVAKTIFFFCSIVRALAI